MIETLGAEASQMARDNPLVGSFSPLWEETDFAFGGVNLSGETSLKVAIS